MRSLKRATATVCVAVAGFVSVVPAASAQQEQDGLVNVAIGDITLEDINVGVAAAIAANVCGVKVGPVAVLGRAVDASGGTEVVCTAPTRVELTQN
jgi:hypothetical protein